MNLFGDVGEVRAVVGVCRVGSHMGAEIRKQGDEAADDVLHMAGGKTNAEEDVTHP